MLMPDWFTPKEFGSQNDVSLMLEGGSRLHPVLLYKIGKRDCKLSNPHAPANSRLVFVLLIKILYIMCFYNINEVKHYARLSSENATLTLYSYITDLLLCKHQTTYNVGLRVNRAPPSRFTVYCVFIMMVTNADLCYTKL